MEEVKTAHASTVMARLDIRMPSLAMPEFRWPRLSRRTRALLMMAIMISPAFLSDAIGFCVMRAFYTADELAEKQASTATLTQVRIFQVACPDTDTPAAEQARWSAYAARHDWPLYPQAGAACFKPDRNLRGVMGLTVFSVACPVMALSATKQRRWAAYAADHHWTDYPQAGTGCVDP
jgi:hypothetical protein